MSCKHGCCTADVKYCHAYTRGQCVRGDNCKFVHQYSQGSVRAFHNLQKNLNSADGSCKHGCCTPTITFCHRYKRGQECSSECNRNHAIADVYLDYHNVLDRLNAGSHAGLTEFLGRMEALPATVHIYVISYRKNPHGMFQTLNELEDTGKAGVFKDIIFTTFRTYNERLWNRKALRSHPLSSRVSRPLAKPTYSREDYNAGGPNGEINRGYMVYHGGKDEFLNMFSRWRQGVPVIFVDDQEAIIEAVQQQVPVVNAIHWPRSSQQDLYACIADHIARRSGSRWLLTPPRKKRCV